MLTIITDKPKHTKLVNEVLAGYGPAFRTWLDAASTTFHILKPNQTYKAVSLALTGCGKRDRLRVDFAGCLRYDRFNVLRYSS